MSTLLNREPYYEIKNLINRSDYTQAEVAEMINMPKTTFSLKINRKNGRDFSFSEAVELAEVLEADVSDFF